MKVNEKVTLGSWDGITTEKMSKKAGETYQIITCSDGGDEGLVFAPRPASI
jgi:hypothetical protein